MKRINIFAVLVSVFALSLAISAQDKVADYSGTWNLDVAKSKLDERMRFESMTLTVSQNAKDITIKTETKRAAPPADAPQGPPPGGGGMGRGGGGRMMGGDGTAVYTFDGKSTKTTVEGPMGSVPVDHSLKVEGTKLKLTRTSSMNTQMGSFVVTTFEIWELGAEGKTLTVKRTMDTPRGSTSSELVFNKKQ